MNVRFVTSGLDLTVLSPDCRCGLGCWQGHMGVGIVSHKHARVAIRSFVGSPNCREELRCCYMEVGVVGHKYARVVIRSVDMTVRSSDNG